MTILLDVKISRLQDGWRSPSFAAAEGSIFRPPNKLSSRPKRRDLLFLQASRRLVSLYSNNEFDVRGERG
jgi:hypothetical protein